MYLLRLQLPATEVGNLTDLCLLSVAVTVASYLYYRAIYPTILEYTIVIAIAVATS